jgi:hypothetical protein
LKAKEDDSDDEDACDDPEIFKLMIEYIYHFDYLRGIDFGPAENKKRAQTGKPATSALGDAAHPPQDLQTWILEHAKVFAMAVKYRVAGLGGLAAAKFKEAVTVYWENPNFTCAISVVHHSTREEVTQLRDMVADILHAHTDVFKKDEHIEQLVYRIAGLAPALLKRSRHEVKRTHDSANCISQHGKYLKRAHMCNTCKEEYLACSFCVNKLDIIPMCPNYRCH